MKKINLLVALTLSLNVFSQELKKDTTLKVIKKSEKGSPGVEYYFEHHGAYMKSVQCKMVSLKGVRCENESAGGYCWSRNCAGKK